jgi:hypothetical protein
VASNLLTVIRESPSRIRGLNPTEEANSMTKRAALASPLLTSLEFNLEWGTGSMLLSPFQKNH